MEHVLLPEKYDKVRSKENFKKDKKGNYMYNDHYCDETVPNLNYLFENGIGFENHPADWFAIDETMLHLALYMLHSILPSLQVEMKFKTQKEDPVNGSDLCTEVFGGNASTRHKQFKAFFSATNPLKPTPPTESHPNWKNDPVLKHMMVNSKNCIVLGSNISIDEQDIGFQGQRRDK